MRFPCPSCGRQLQLDDNAAGKNCRCPSCQNQMRAPSAGDAVTHSQIPAAQPTDDKEARVYSLLCQWASHCEKGAKMSIAELCRENPELEGDVRRRLQGLETVGSLLEVLYPNSSELVEAVKQRLQNVETADWNETLDQEPGRSPSGTESTSVPGYEILDVLGRGGMGVVYKARQIKADRVVALKMILAGAHAGQALLDRFTTEAHAVARLQHPNIVQIYEVGEHDGLPYFTLEYCAGDNLSNKIAGTPVQPQEAAALVEKLARAMHAAHEKNIVHRDLKPANILLALEPKTDTRNAKRNRSTESATSKASDSENERAAELPPNASPALPLSDFAPKITDFGLAKKLDDAGQTNTGAVMGTPSYMAPEQAGGKTGEIGPLADVYALGAILYELMTGRPPFRGATPMDTIMQVLTKEPVPPSQLNPNMPRDLETVCLKCLQKDPVRRYESADALAEEMRRFQAGEPIQARPVSRTERAWRWCRRNPVVALLSGAVAATFIVGTLVAALFAWQSHANAQHYLNESLVSKEKERVANNNLALARYERDLARRGTYNVQLARVQAIMDRDPYEARRLLEESSSCPPELRDFTWELLHGLTKRDRLTLFGHEGAVHSLTFSPDNKKMASRDDNGMIKIWDTATGQNIFTLVGQSGFSLAYSPDGKNLAFGGDDGFVRICDAQTCEVTASLAASKSIISNISYSPDGQLLAANASSKPVGQTVSLDTLLWNVATGRLFLQIPNTDGPIAYSPDGHFLAVTDVDRFSIKVWDIDAGRRDFDLPSQAAGIPADKGSSPISTISFSPDGGTLVVGYFDEKLVFWDVVSRKPNVIASPHNMILSVAFSPDGKLLATSGGPMRMPGQVYLWDVATRAIVASLKGHNDCVEEVRFSSDGSLLGTASGDRTAKLWDVLPRPAWTTLGGHTGSISRLAFSPDGRILASAAAGEDSFEDNEPEFCKPGDVKLWDVRTGTLRATLLGHAKWVSDVSFSSNGSQLASASGDGTVKIWDVTTAKEMVALDGGFSIDKVEFGKTSRTVVSSSFQKTIVWNVETGEPRLFIKNRVAAYSPDGRLAAVTVIAAGPNCTIEIWDLESGKICGKLGPLGSRGGEKVVFSADGHFVAAETNDAQGKHLGVTVWESTSGARRLMHQSKPLMFFFTRSGLLATVDPGKLSQTIALWDPTTATKVDKTVISNDFGNMLAPCYSDGKSQCSISPDGRTLVVVDEEIKLLDPWTGHIRVALRKPNGFAYPSSIVVFSPDGSTLACAGYRKGEQIHILKTR